MRNCLCTTVLYYHLMETSFVSEACEGQRRPTQPSTDLELTRARCLNFFRIGKGLWLLTAMQVLEVDDLPRRGMWKPPGIFAKIEDYQ